MSKFKVGDKVWNASCRWEKIKQVCPTCFGKKEITLILGNDDRVIIPCKGCSLGYESPSGIVEEYDYIVEPKLVFIDGMSIEIEGDKEKVTYKGGCYWYYDENLFVNKEDAAKEAKKKRKTLFEEQSNKVEHIKKNVHKDFSWNASYHIRQANNARKDAARHDALAKICKKRSKKED